MMKDTLRRSSCFAAIVAALAIALSTGICQAALTFVHVSDTHFPHGRSGERFQQMLAEIETLDPRPSFIIHTGDVTELGTREQVEGFSALLGEPTPPAEAGLVAREGGWRDRFYAVLGNHDVRWTDLGSDELADLLLPKAPLDRPPGRLFYGFDQEGVRFIGLDTTIPWEQHGMLDPQQLTWLREPRRRMSLPQVRAMVAFCHHPLVLPEGEALPGTGGPRNLRMLLTMLSANVDPVVVLCGHGHQTRAWRGDRMTFVMTGGTYQDNAGYRVITVDGDRITSRLRRWANPEVALDEPEVLAERGREEYDFPSIPPAAAPAAANAPDPGRVRWRGRLKGAVQAQPVITGDSVLVSGWAGVTEFAAATGDFRQQIGDGSRLVAEVAWADGTLYAPAGRSLVARRGDEVLWTFAADCEIRSPVVVAGDVVYTAAGRTLYALDSATGEERWRYRANGAIQNAIAATEDTVFLGAWDNRFRALEAATGDEKWSVPIGDSVYRSPATGVPAVGDGKVIVTASQNENVDGVTALDAATGEKAWSARAQAGYCSPVIANGRVYVTALEGTVLCLSLADGSKVWEQRLGEPIYDSSCAVGEGAVVVPGLRGTVFCLDAETGARRWSHRVTDGYLFARPAIAEGMAVVAGMDGSLTALPLTQ